MQRLLLLLLVKHRRRRREKSDKIATVNVLGAVDCGGSGGTGVGAITNRNGTVARGNVVNSGAFKDGQR